MNPITPTHAPDVYSVLREWKSITIPRTLFDMFKVLTIESDESLSVFLNFPNIFSLFSTLSLCEASDDVETFTSILKLRGGVPGKLSPVWAQDDTFPI